jgi:hypothetical protein
VTLTQSDVHELLDAIRAGGHIDVIRKGVEVVLQALIGSKHLQRVEIAHRSVEFLFAESPVVLFGGIGRLRGRFAMISAPNNAKARRPTTCASRAR